MEIKKNPKSNLENYSKLFMQLGLVLALFVTYVAIENKTYDKEYGDLGSANMASEIEEETIEIQPEAPKPPQKTPPPPAPKELNPSPPDAILPIPKPPAPPPPLAFLAVTNELPPSPP